MSKFLFIIFMSILMAVYPNGGSNVMNAPTDNINLSQQEVQNPGTSQSAETSISPETIESPETSQRVQYPKILTLNSATQIEYAVKSEGVYCIYNGKKYGFMNDSGVEITPYQYDYAYPLSEGLACVQLGGKYGFINDKGSTSISLEYDKAAPFSEGLAYFAKGDKYGFIDKNGEVAFLLNCDSVSSFKEGLAYFFDNGKYGYIDKTGTLVIKPIYDDADYFKDGLAKVRIGLKYGLINKNGTEIVPVEYDEISYDGRFITYKVKGKYGCFDKNGKLIFQPLYDTITILPSEDAAIVYKGDKPEIIDFNGNKMTTADYDNITYDGIITYDGRIYDGSENSDGMITVQLKGKTGFLDGKDFKEVIPPVYDLASSFIKGKAVVVTGGGYQCGVIDKSGNIVIPLNYNYIQMFHNGTVALNKKGTYVLADASGKIILNKEYDNIYEAGNFYIVETDGKYGIIDNAGKEKVQPIYDSISIRGYNTVYNSSSSFVAAVYGDVQKEYMIETGPEQTADLSDLLLQNVITPRIKPYSKFYQTGSFHIPAGDNRTSEISVGEDIKDCIIHLKLYDLDGSGESLLYCVAVPLIGRGPGHLSYSGLYSEKNGKLKELVTGYECGGTLGGDLVRIFKDTETNKLLVGSVNHAGGFMGNASGCDIYDYQNKKTKKIASYECITQSTENYKKSDLMKQAELFYDDNDKPYNKDTVLQADTVTEYQVNGKQVTRAEYNKIEKRYELMEDFITNQNDLIR